MELKVIARVRNDFPTKFGLPRQSALASRVAGAVVFEPAYRNADALRGIEGFSHLWLLWEFQGFGGGAWSPTVRPPRLGGNARLGVFATRSPNRPNPLAMSCVRLLGVESDPALGAVLRVSGCDMMDGTPVFDIKPYLPYADSVPGAAGGFAAAPSAGRLRVSFPPELLERVPARLRPALIQALECDPRPAFHADPLRVYGMPYAGLDIRFTVDAPAGLLAVVGVAAL